MAIITEIAPDMYRISIYVRDFDLQFIHFIVRDEAGMRKMFPELHEAVSELLDPKTI